MARAEVGYRLESPGVLPMGGSAGGTAGSEPSMAWWFLGHSVQGAPWGCSVRHQSEDLGVVCAGGALACHLELR